MKYLQKDFTIKVYRILLEGLKEHNYSFFSFKDYLELCLATVKVIQDFSEFSLPENKNSLCCILRHDVDRKPQNSLNSARIEHELGITGSYYFRINTECFNREIIEKIAKLGHEVGYHYEDVDLINKQFIRKRKKICEDELIDLAYESFCKNLQKMREIIPVNTICMHGSPLSAFDNKIIWKKYSYKDLGISGEPYLDIDFNEFAYLTDTGRKWNASDSSIRDKVDSRYQFSFRSTQAILENIKSLPKNILITVHPQRWNDDILSWFKELFSQNCKNIIKKYLFANRSHYNVPVLPFQK